MYRDFIPSQATVDLEKPLRQRYGIDASENRIVVNAIIARNTVHTARVLDELRAAGELITTSEIEHIYPARPPAHSLLRLLPV